MKYEWLVYLARILFLIILTLGSKKQNNMKLKLCHNYFKHFKMIINNNITRAKIIIDDILGLESNFKFSKAEVLACCIELVS